MVDDSKTVCLPVAFSRPFSQSHSWDLVTLSSTLRRSLLKCDFTFKLQARLKYELNLLELKKDYFESTGYTRDHVQAT